MMTRVAILGACIATGDFSAASSWATDDASVERRTGAFSRIATRIARLAIGIIPGAAFLVAEYGLHLNLNPAIQTAWGTLSVAWGLTTFSSIIPEYKDRIGATKDVVGMLTPPTK
jgi:hypothetical protein